MTETEYRQAGRALNRWFQSQKIDPQDAIRLMVEQIAAIIYVEARQTGKSPTPAFDAVSTMLAAWRRARLSPTE